MRWRTVVLGLALCASACALEPSAPGFEDGGSSSTSDAPVGVSDAAPAPCAFDVDGDGTIDRRCGGQDCDDRSSDIHPGSAERCGNGRDDDCDDLVDEEGCTPPDRPSCGRPLVARESGSYRLTPSPGAGALDCSSAFTAALQLEITEPRSVRVDAASLGGADLSVALRASCEGPPSSCFESSDLSGGVPLARGSVPRLSPGTYFLTASATTEDDVIVSLTLEAPAASGGTSCADPVVLSGSTAVLASLSGRTNFAMVMCASGEADVDMVFRVDLSATSDVEARVVSAGEDSNQLALELRSDCTASSSAISCGSARLGGAPSRLRARALAPGSYYLVVSGPATATFDFDLTIQPPTTAPPADRCENRGTLESGTAVRGSLVGTTREFLETCSAETRFDAVHEFGSTSRVEHVLELDVDVGWALLDVLARCAADGESLVACGGALVQFFDHERRRIVYRLTRTLDPGRRFAVVSALYPSDYTLTWHTQEPVTALALAGAESCGDAGIIPPTGGRYRVQLERDDHTFEPAPSLGCAPPPTAGPDRVLQLQLTERSRVTALLETTSETTERFEVGLFQGTCEAASRMPCLVGSRSWRRVLEPGTYFLVLEADAPAEFLLTVEIEEVS